MDDHSMSDLETEPKPARRIWILAAVGALVLHFGGGALAVARLQTGESDAQLGTEAIEIGLEVSSPHLDTMDAPPGPDQDASAASPALPEQKAEVKETELPKDVPTETEDPDRVVAPNDAQKPKDDAKVAQVQSSATPESVPQVAMATPSLEEVPEGRSQAPVQGLGKSLERLEASWMALVGAQFKRHLRLPDVAQDKNIKVWVNVSFDRMGHVVSSSIAESSGYPAYDKAALAMVHHADPVPKPPPLVADGGLSYRLPVVFNAPK
jgi:TonB family protein